MRVGSHQDPEATKKALACSILSFDEEPTSEIMLKSLSDLPRDSCRRFAGHYERYDIQEEAEALNEGLNSSISRLRLSIQTNPGLLRSDSATNLPKAAVGVVLAPDQNEGELTTLLVKRKKSAGDPWSGHMAFPGGRLKSGESLFQTVEREVLEETGIDVHHYEFLGGLDELPTGNFSIMVSPFVFFAQQQVNAVIELREIEDFVWIPMSFFSDKRNAKEMQVEVSGILREVLSFPCRNSYVVWGMTLRVIDDLLGRM